MAQELKQLKRGDTIPAELINELIRLSKRRVFASGMNVYEDSTGWHISLVNKETDETGKVLLAQTQEAAPASNHISVKLLDSSGNVTGSAFDAYGFFVDGATTFTGVTPIIANGKTVPVFLGNDGKWYLDMTLTYLGEACEEEE
ncbi:MAG: hypothetical protein WC464_05745 [Bdellovibrionales bacterium]